MMSDASRVTQSEGRPRHDPQASRDAIVVAVLQRKLAETERELRQLQERPRAIQIVLAAFEAGSATREGRPSS